MEHIGRLVEDRMFVYDARSVANRLHMAEVIADTDYLNGIGVALSFGALGSAKFEEKFEKEILSVLQWEKKHYSDVNNWFDLRDKTIDCLSFWVRAENVLRMKRRIYKVRCKRLMQRLINKIMQTLSKIKKKLMKER